MYNFFAARLMNTLTSRALYICYYFVSILLLLRQYFTVIIIIDIVTIIIDNVMIIPLSLATLFAIRLASDLVYRSIH